MTSISSKLTDSIALAHWHCNAWGGSEYLVTKLAEVLDLNTIYTIGQPDPDSPNPYGDVEWVDVTSGPIDTLRQKIGRAGEYALWEDVDWRAFGDPDILITSGSTTRAVITPDDVLHVNYCHSPPRWLYDLYHDRKASLAGTVARPAIRYLRLRDQSVDPRVDTYLANSPIIQKRIWKYYNRESTVLYPPVDLSAYYNDSSEEFFLHLGRLDIEKGIDAVVSAFEQRTEQLILAGGQGDADKRLLRRIQSAPNIEYQGFIPEQKKYELLATCRAVVFNGVNEDFGIVPIEANASGKPCLVRDDGFPCLFVDDGYNGLVHNGTARGIREALDRIDEVDASLTEYGSLVKPFSLSVFERRLNSLLTTYREEMRLQFQAPDPTEYVSPESFQ